MGTGVAVGGVGAVGVAVGADWTGRSGGIGVWVGSIVGVGLGDSQAKTNSSRPAMTMALALVICLMPPLLDHPITTAAACSC